MFLSSSRDVRWLLSEFESYVAVYIEDSLYENVVLCPDGPVLISATKSSVL